MPRAVPIHTISFNCNDREANEFLYELAKESGGRFHYYSQDGCEIDLDGPEPWQVNTYSKNIVFCCYHYFNHRHHLYLNQQ